MRNYFTIGSKASTDFGVYISGQGTFDAAGRAYNMIAVPGRNGDLVGPEKRFLNGTLTYPAFIYSNFSKNIEDFRNFLLSLFGYHDLVDTYHPNEIRKVLFAGPFIANVETKNDAGSFDLSFNCKPQRFLSSGNTPVTLTGSGSITNPTLFPSQPLLRVYGTGTLGIGSHSITINQADVYTDIDCEMMDAYKGTDSKNGSIELSGYNFPVLEPGANTITFGAGITQVDITPRWFVL